MSSQKIPEDEMVFFLNALENLTYTQLQRVKFEVEELIEEIEEMQNEQQRV